MKKSLFVSGMISLSFLWAGASLAADPAVFIDGAAQMQNNGESTLTITKNLTSSVPHRYLFFMFETSPTAVVGSVTWNGAPLSPLNSPSVFIGRKMYVYGLANPVTDGEHDAVVTMASGLVGSGAITLYAQADELQPGSAFTSGPIPSGESITATVTTTYPDSLVFLFLQEGASDIMPIPVGDAVLRTGDFDGPGGDGGAIAAIERGPLPSGTHSISASFPPAGGHYVAFAIKAFNAQNPLLVVDGGTGASTFTTNGVLLGNGTDPLFATAAGTAGQVFRVPNGGGAPAFGAIDLSQSASITGVLPVANGGTGISSPFTSGSIVFAGAGGAFTEDNTRLSWDATNQRLTVVGTIAGAHFKGTGSTPAISVGSCAGTGGSVSMTGTDAAGKITLTTGTATPGNAACFTLTYVTPYSDAPYVVFTPANAAASALNGTHDVYASSTASNLKFVTGSTGLANNTAYQWMYQVVE